MLRLDQSMKATCMKCVLSRWMGTGQYLHERQTDKTFCCSFTGGTLKRTKVHKYTNTQMQKYTIHNICMKDRQTKSLVQIILSPNNYRDIYEYS